MNQFFSGINVNADINKLVFVDLLLFVRTFVYVDVKDNARSDIENEV